MYFREQQILKLKNEKLKIAMMKLKEASVQKVCTSIYVCSVSDHTPSLWASLDCKHIHTHMHVHA